MGASWRGEKDGQTFPHFRCVGVSMHARTILLAILSFCYGTFGEILMIKLVGHLILFDPDFSCGSE